MEVTLIMHEDGHRSCQYGRTIPQGDIAYLTHKDISLEQLEEIKSAPADKVESILANYLKKL